MKRMKRSSGKRHKSRPGTGTGTEGTPTEILAHEAKSLLDKHLHSQANGDASEEDGVPLSRQRPSHSPLPPHHELELEIEMLSSTGDGLAVSPDKNHVYVVPFAIPGDIVVAKTFPGGDNHGFSILDLVKVRRPSPQREGTTPGCQYFGSCAGCQLQMMSYEDQLQHKKTVVERAFAAFSNLDPSMIPPVGDTMGSPLRYGYRTKITPHYDGPARRDPKNYGGTPPKVGFSVKNTRRVFDLEECPIATPILNEGLKIERKKVHQTFHTRKTGATILLRESTRRQPLPASATGKSEPSLTSDPYHNLTWQPLVSTNDRPASASRPTSTASPETESGWTASGSPEIRHSYPTYQDIKTYTSENGAMTTEYVGDFTFESRANSFFQNNNSILPSFVQYVRDNCNPPHLDGAPIKYLLDAYCGSGLFAVTLSPTFRSVLGIDIDVQGIEAARVNAQNNKVDNAGFIAADAEHLFVDIPFPPDQTLCVIDPPRKGASQDFLRQMSDFGPKRVVYVSCNVHTQARDVGLLVAGFGGRWRYKIESLRGFDFFPQTGHVEGVCVLNRTVCSP